MPVIEQRTHNHSSSHSLIHVRNRYCSGSSYGQTNVCHIIDALPDTYSPFTHTPSPSKAYKTNNNHNCYSYDLFQTKIKCDYYCWVVCVCVCVLPTPCPHSEWIICVFGCIVLGLLQNQPNEGKINMQLTQQISIVPNANITNINPFAIFKHFYVSIYLFFF